MIGKALVAASTKPLILSILEFRESYGYQIIQRVKELSGEQLQWADGMLYPVLHRLEKDGFITSSWQISESGRKRKYYAITDQGVTELQNEKQQWLDVNSIFAQLWGLKLTVPNQ